MCNYANFWQKHAHGRVMTRYIENINISYGIGLLKNIEFLVYCDIQKYHDILRYYPHFSIFSTNSSLRHMTGNKDYKCGKLMM